MVIIQRGWWWNVSSPTYVSDLVWRQLSLWVRFPAQRIVKEKTVKPRHLFTLPHSHLFQVSYMSVPLVGQQAFRPCGSNPTAATCILNRMYFEQLLVRGGNSHTSWTRKIMRFLLQKGILFSPWQIKRMPIQLQGFLPKDFDRFWRLQQKESLFFDQEKTRFMRQVHFATYSNPILFSYTWWERTEE